MLEKILYSFCMLDLAGGVILLVDFLIELLSLLTLLGVSSCLPSSESLCIYMGGVLPPVASLTS